MDDKVLCTLEKPFEWKSIEGLNVLSSVNMTEYPSSHDRALPSRLLVRYDTQLLVFSG